jgi:hypothetical protein
VIKLLGKGMDQSSLAILFQLMVLLIKVNGQCLWFLSSFSTLCFQSKCLSERLSMSESVQFG